MKKGLFKKILVAMMCIALTLGMAACGSKKVKVGTGENQSSEDTVKGSKSADDLVKAVAANKKGLENFTVSFDAKLDADLDLKQALVMQGMTEEMIESAIKEGKLKESDLKSSAKAGINGTLKICDEAGYAEGKSYAKIPDVTEDSQELKTYLVKEGNTAYVYEYDFDDEKWMKEESDTSLSDVIASLRNVTAITDFIKTGVYDKNRNFYTTISPSMDILVSSNLERLLYKLSGDNDEVTRGWMNALKSEGKYEVSDDVKAVINEKFYGGFCDDKNTEATIHEMFEQDKYLCDTHTAVAINVYKQYVEETGDKTPSVIASTASPYKFSKAVLEAVEPNATLPETEFDMVDELHKVSGAEVPAPLANLKNKTARFSDVTEVRIMFSEHSV